jgi:hypothetical protein
LERYGAWDVRLWLPERTRCRNDVLGEIHMAMNTDDQDNGITMTIVGVLGVIAIVGLMLFAFGGFESKTESVTIDLKTPSAPTSEPASPPSNPN